MPDAFSTMGDIYPWSQDPTAEKRVDPTVAMSSQDLWSKLAIGVDPHFTPAAQTNTIFVGSPTQAAGMLGSFSELREGALQAGQSFVNMGNAFDERLRSWFDEKPPPTNIDNPFTGIIEGTRTAFQFGAAAGLLLKWLPVIILLLSNRKKRRNEDE